MISTRSIDELESEVDDLLDKFTRGEIREWEAAAEAMLLQQEVRALRIAIKLNWRRRRRAQ